MKSYPSAADPPTPEERATWGCPPSGKEAAAVYGRILSQLARKREGITAEHMEGAYRLTLEIEKDLPDKAIVKHWSGRLGLDWEWLPHRRTLGPGEGQSLVERWNEAEKALKAP